ncbi:MAG: glycoside hydrolase family 3 N-terminal domain-containing protein, partial [Candidatus Nanopelagicales bacterium]|nr:glycoside hydrolase family 3 N-terminal domain-containing protein [Candidatus Nanopelagicales bacterium]
GLVLSACSSGSPEPSGSAECSNRTAIAEWPIQRRLGQLLMGGAPSSLAEQSISAAVNSIADGKVGGVNFLGSNSTAYADGQLAQVVDAGGEVPPFLAVDEEGGRVQRLEGITGYLPSARSMAEDMSSTQVKKQGTAIGRTMRKLWLNMDLAPVVDVSSQPDDSVIGDRSFSDDPETVTKFAGAFADGLRAGGVIPVLKHFPGLGSAIDNSGAEPLKTQPLSKLERSDLIPYESLLSAEPVAVMLTNAAVPGLTKGRPATFSPFAYQLLRDEFGFQGVAMTNSLSAVAIARNISIAKAAEKAIAAGADIALWDSLDEASDVIKQLRKAVEAGRIAEGRVNDSVDRILALKQVDLCANR